MDIFDLYTKTGYSYKRKLTEYNSMFLDFTFTFLH